MYFVSIDVGAKWPLFYSHVDHVWSLLIVGTSFVSWGTKETLPDFSE